jgi:uncharacterized membrane protein YdjX (TVP38/TMEM64 family)
MTGFLNLDSIKAFLESVQNYPAIYVGGAIAFLLFADLFVAVPTLSLCILSGYFLGFYHGLLFAAIGVTAAGVCGYLLSYRYGDKVINFILKDEAQRRDLIQSFGRYKAFMILSSRAIPILPEVTACLSGMTKMKFLHFLFYWLASSIPYAAIAAYSGSISTFDDPKPAIFAAIGMTCFFSISWYIFRRNISGQKKVIQAQE